MRLYVEHKGELFEVDEEIDGYNLDKVMAQSSVCHDIAQTIKYIKEADPTIGDEQIA